MCNQPRIGGKKHLNLNWNPMRNHALVVENLCIHPLDWKKKTPLLFVTGQRNCEDSLLKIVEGMVYTQAQWCVTDGVLCRGWVLLEKGILPNEINYFGYGRLDLSKRRETLRVVKGTRLQLASNYKQGTECKQQGEMSVGAVPAINCSYTTLITDLGGVVGEGPATIMVAVSADTYKMIEKTTEEIMILKAVELVRVGENDNTMQCEVATSSNEVKYTVQHEVDAIYCGDKSFDVMDFFCRPVSGVVDECGSRGSLSEHFD